MEDKKIGSKDTQRDMPQQQPKYGQPDIERQPTTQVPTDEKKDVGRFDKKDVGGQQGFDKKE